MSGVERPLLARESRSRTQANVVRGRVPTALAAAAAACCAPGAIKPTNYHLATEV